LMKHVSYIDINTFNLLVRINEMLNKRKFSNSRKE